MRRWAGIEADPASAHKYTYTRNDPLNGQDPTGYFDIGSLGAIVSIVSINATIARPAQTASAGKGMGGTYTGNIFDYIDDAVGAALRDALAHSIAGGTKVVGGGRADSRNRVMRPEYGGVVFEFLG